MSVTYAAVMDVSEDSVLFLFLSGPLAAERTRRGTRKDTRSLTTYRQAVLVLRWFLEDSRICALARESKWTELVDVAMQHCCPAG